MGGEPDPYSNRIRAQKVILIPLPDPLEQLYPVILADHDRVSLSIEALQGERVTLLGRLLSHYDNAWHSLVHLNCPHSDAVHVPMLHRRGLWSDLWCRLHALMCRLRSVDMLLLRWSDALCRWRLHLGTSDRVGRRSSEPS